MRSMVEGPPTQVGGLLVSGLGATGAPFVIPAKAGISGGETRRPPPGRPQLSLG